jgi:hypothetical protein
MAHRDDSLLSAKYKKVVSRQEIKLNEENQLKLSRATQTNEIHEY